MSALFLALSLLACRSEYQHTPYLDPILVLEGPAEGGWEDPGPIEAYGLVEHLDDVTLEGETVAVEAGSFRREVTLKRGMNLLEARGVDSRGDVHWVRNGVLAGRYQSPGERVKNAALLRVNEPGLDLLMGKVEDLMTPSLLNQTLAGSGPVYEYDAVFGGGDFGTVFVAVEQVDFSRLSIDATPREGRMDLVIEMTDLWVDLLVTGDVVGQPFELEADMWADPATVLATATLSTTDRGKLDLTLQDVAVNLEDFGFDTSTLGSLEAGFPMVTIRDLLEERLEEAVMERLPPVIEEQLQTLDLSYETELLGERVTAAASFGSATIDPDGIELGVDVAVEVEANAGYFYRGSLLFDGAAPDIDHNVPLAATLADDFLNRVLFEAWKGGLLEQTLSSADGSLPVSALEMVGASEGSVDVLARLPPVVIQNDSGNLEAQLTEAIVTLRTPGGTLGDEVTVAVAAWVDLQPQVVAGVLRLAVGEPRVVVQVRDSSGRVSNETMTTLIQTILPLEGLMSLLRDFEFPLPELAGIRVVYAEVARDTAGGHTDLLVALE